MILIYKVCPEKDKIVSKEPVEEKPKEQSSQEKYKYILSQRKAYVEWVNNEFYDKLMSNIDNDMYKSYQKFVKGYLSMETPFRGLLVYHGLGTGKTATAIITTEGLSSRRINTFLPKSLKENFISEIKDKKFTNDEYDINSNNWQLHKNDELEDKYLVQKLEKYDLKGIKQNVLKSTKKQVKKNSPDKISEIENGIFIKISDYYDDTKDIYTTTGELIENDIIKSQDLGWISVIKLSDVNIIQLEQQINEFILNKYNFIHSNALPKITKKQLSNLEMPLDDDAKILLEDDEQKSVGQTSNYGQIN